MTTTSDALPMIPEPRAHALAPSYSSADVQAMAEAVAKSRLFPGIDTPQAAFTLMMLCQAEGLHPMQAVKRYHVIDGRPTMRSDAMLAEFHAHRGRVKWHRYDDEACEATFAHPDLCPEGLTIVHTLAEMKKKGISEGRSGTKDNWRRFPANMLRARVISDAIRIVDPGLIVGIYTPEEVADFDPPSARLAPRAEALPAPTQEPPKKPLYRERYPSDKAPAEPFHDFLGRAVDEWAEFSPLADDKAEADREWDARCHRLVQRVVTDAIADDLIAEESVLKPAEAGKGPSRDPRKAWEAAEWLYREQPDFVRLAVRTGLDRKRTEVAAPASRADGDDRMSANPEPVAAVALAN